MTKPRGRKASKDRRSGRHLNIDEFAGEGGPEEAAVLIAEVVSDLAKLARRHKLELLDHILSMAKLEAEVCVQMRSKRKLS